MEAVICDTCGIQANPDAYGMAPNGWLSVSTRGDYSTSKDYCSKPCAVMAISPSPVPVSDVERTINEAEHRGLSPASFV